MWAISRPEAVRLLGIADRTFTRLESAGALRAARRGRGATLSEYDAPSLVQDFLAHERRKIQGSQGSPRDRAYTAQAELAEFRLARERGLYLPRAEWVARGQALAAALTAKLRALPSRLARVGVITSEREPEALAAVDEILREIAAWRTTTDLETAAGQPPADEESDRDDDDDPDQ